MFSDFTDSSDEYLIVDSVVNADGKCSTSKCPKLRFFKGQRKSVQLVYSQYAYAKNKEHGPTIYWNCRVRRTGVPPCSARLSTRRLANGRYKVWLTRPEHNHAPSKRIARMLKDI
ncbi:uncharacterized protein LOC117790269 [Drosophila innubila]|uniref:uncharacterized protein LOC117790269 n=1 Tax=Drosophila innubila TaxID=198719 RepID=UPI00148DBF38|nr:uncharacterized protein LOC117790269 [Drosophila innubila]